MRPFFLLIFLSSCGSLKVIPNGCQSNGNWSKNIEKPIVLTETYYIWNMDQEIRLKNFLKERAINCNEVKELKISIASEFFVKRILSIHISK
jgi:hypothetical protein